MKELFVLMALAPIACGAAWGVRYNYTGSTIIGEESDNVTVQYGDTKHMDRQIEIAAKEAKLYAMEKCGTPLYCLHYQVQPDLFNCGDITEAKGCYSYGSVCIMQYTTEEKFMDTSMLHETMHYIYDLCNIPDGDRVKHFPAFYDDLKKLRDRVEAKLKEEGLE